MLSWSREVGGWLLDVLADTFPEYAIWVKSAADWDDNRSTWDQDVPGGPSRWDGSGSRRKVIKGRFRIDPWETPTGTIEPGIGEVQTWFYCNRRRVPPPLPELGDHLIIFGHVWEIVQRDEDDLGELGYRLIKEELGLLFPDVRGGDWDDNRSMWDRTVPGGPSRWDAGVSTRRAPGRPTRGPEIAETFENAANAGIIGPDMPMSEVVSTVRERIPGDRRGLGDKTLRRKLGPLLAARQRRP